ncbi:SDR family oxidoreductase [Phyllobacterium bourgognense]|uniref:NAD(P)-dependent dehydrogenase (Short-subunit alcohol dehydrogenase family) n=1 Tax=Phyllobacterium bourgognense TaxID=314236 RepID=A0A368YMQ6_9HYPH|nr:SDR family oxidoreductase [Phyllobacterium bourgognense]RCW81510.1 NAD(P)-dependent dehydrogenase (short-subunit alcohol dehydrogenase family) [Phyllobacterium bourgognense]
MAQGNLSRHETAGNTTAKRHREIQAQIDKIDERKGSSAKEKAPQTGARAYPVPPFPRQHLKKPGIEATIEPAPMYDAPYYEGSKKLDGKVALITGGDSGIGRAVAVLYAREGADVVIVHLDEERDADKTRKLVEKEGGRCLVIAGDVRKRDFCEDAVKQTIKTFGEIDVLVNNAAFQLHTDDFQDLTEEHFDETIKTNLYGYFFLAQAAAREMKPGSAIINTGSVTGFMGSKNLIDYSMTKGGIHAFTRALSGNLLSRGIRVNAVAPGPVWTPLNPADKAAGDVSKFGSDTPMKRPAQPEELAPAYVFLASSHCSSYITGEILPVVGGY